MKMNPWLDKFWQHQDVICDFTAEIHGTGNSWNRKSELLLDISITISNCILEYKIRAYRGIGLHSIFLYVCVYV